VDELAQRIARRCQEEPVRGEPFARALDDPQPDRVKQRGVQDLARCRGLQSLGRLHPRDHATDANHEDLCPPPVGLAPECASAIAEPGCMHRRQAVRELRHGGRSMEEGRRRAGRAKHPARVDDMGQRGLLVRRPHDVSRAEACVLPEDRLRRREHLVGRGLRIPVEVSLVEVDRLPHGILGADRRRRAASRHPVLGGLRSLEQLLRVRMILVRLDAERGELAADDRLELVAARLRDGPVCACLDDQWDRPERMSHGRGAARRDQTICE
jgi:hypothetical protein